MTFKTAPFTIPAPFPAHRGFAVTHYEKMDTQDGVAFRAEVSCEGQVAVTGENSGHGGPTIIDYAGGDLHARFLAIADGTLMDAEGNQPLEDEDDVLELLISTYENERRSVTHTLLRTDLPDPGEDNLPIRDTFSVNGRQPLSTVRGLAIDTAPHCTEWYVPGQGWVSLT